MCIVNIPDDEAQVPDEEEEGETIGMTTNADVKNYKAVDELNGGIKNGASAGVELRKRKESFAKRQQSFQRQNSCGMEIDRPLTREDLRKSFGRSNTISSVSADNETVTTSVAGEE